MNYNKFLLLVALICVPVIGRAVTVIPSLPYTITTPGTYVLESNLTGNGTNGIVVAASNVSINLGGYALIQDPPTATTFSGIWVTGGANVNIQNGTITGFPYGVALGASSSTLKNIRVFDSMSNALFSDGIQVTANDCLVENCTIVGVGYTGAGYSKGIEISECGGVRVRDCQISGFEYGIYSGSATKPNAIIGNYEANFQWGLLLDQFSKFQRNVMTNCGSGTGGIAVGRENG